MTNSEWYEIVADPGLFGRQHSPDNFGSKQNLSSIITTIKDDPDKSPEDLVEENGIEIPDILPILPLRGLVVYPLTAVPLTVGQPRSIKLVDDVAAGERIIGLLTSKIPGLETPGTG